MGELAFCSQDYYASFNLQQPVCKSSDTLRLVPVMPAIMFLQIAFSQPAWVVCGSRPTVGYQVLAIKDG